MQSDLKRIRTRDARFITVDFSPPSPRYVLALKDWKAAGFPNMRSAVVFIAEAGRAFYKDELPVLRDLCVCPWIRDWEDYLNPSTDIEIV